MAIPRKFIGNTTGENGSNNESSSSSSSSSVDSSMNEEEEECAKSGDDNEDDHDMMEEEELDDQVMKELLAGDGKKNMNNNGDDSMEEEDATDDDDTPLLNYNYEYSPTKEDTNKTQSSSDDPHERHRKRIETIECASIQILKVIEKYGTSSSSLLPSSLDPNDNKEWKIDGGDGAWSNPSLAMEEIVNAGEAMVNAWGSIDDKDDDDNHGEDRDDDDGDGDTQKEEWWKPILANNKSNHKNSGDQTQRDRTAAALFDRKESSSSSTLTNQELNQFEMVHMEWATNAFAEELDALRMGRLLDTTKQHKKGGNGSAATAEQQLPAVELDPTQYSFVTTTAAKTDDGESQERKDEVDVQVLADMIRSGGVLLSNGERRMLLRARERGAGMTTTSNENGGLVLGLHERRKREIGFR